MSSACTLTARTAATLEQIGQERVRLGAVAANLSTESRTHREMVLLDGTLADLHLLVVREYGQWKRGEISGTALSNRLDQWDLPSS
jgi:alkanesulfonate monooxygenase SsuD/methylene tetrahydromethanopterin reductase-like flavin-dependent oxidoreductase (luciferase family)